MFRYLTLFILNVTQLIQFICDHASFVFFKVLSNCVFVFSPQSLTGIYNHIVDASQELSRLESEVWLPFLVVCIHRLT